MSTLIKNKKAYYYYNIQEEFEAGLVLTGSEVKSLRAGKANISESYAHDMGGEFFL